MSHSIAIIGAGPAGLMAALHLARSNIGPITIYERMPSAGRKFLMAGRGGLNLTHSMALPEFLTRYGAQAAALEPAILAFTPQDLRAFVAALGEDTFVGTSGRVFPKSFKASPLLRLILRELDQRGVRFAFRHRWLGWEGSELLFETPQGQMRQRADASLLALGGGSWSKLGSDGQWCALLRERGVKVAPLEPANCGFEHGWSTHFIGQFAGAPLKNVRFICGDQALRGEAIVTASGIEGSAIYALGATLRAQIKQEGVAQLRLDFRPDFSEDDLARKLDSGPSDASTSSRLRKIGLTPVQIGLMREIFGKNLPRSGKMLSGCAKNLSVPLTLQPSFERAISTAGGVCFEALDGALMLRALPGTFVAGEMLDFDAPTGGFLLQAAFSTGLRAAMGLQAWLEGRSPA